MRFFPIITHNITLNRLHRLQITSISTFLDSERSEQYIGFTMIYYGCILFITFSENIFVLVGALRRSSRFLIFVVIYLKKKKNEKIYGN